MSEFKCETCGVSSPDNAHCRNCTGSYSSNNPYSQWQSKTASPIGELKCARGCVKEYNCNSTDTCLRFVKPSPIGETVLTDEEILGCFEEYKSLFPNHTPVTCDNEFMMGLLKAQDAHTRKEVAKVIKARLVDDGMLFIREPQLQDWFEAFIKELEGK
jgi:hypothetical protein